MKKNKFFYTLSAFMMACIISFSGVSGTYLQAHASNPGVTSILWNDDVSAWENIKKYLTVFTSAIGLYMKPNAINGAATAQSVGDFFDYMISDNNWSKQESHDALCGCGNVYTSCPAFVSDGDVPSFDIIKFVSGGGGHVRDGITQDEDGNVTISDEVADLFHGYVTNYLETESGYWVVETMAADELPKGWFSSTEVWNNVVTTIENFDICGLYLESSAGICNYISVMSHPNYIYGFVFDDSEYYPDYFPVKVILDSDSGYYTESLRRVEYEYSKPNLIEQLPFSPSQIGSYGTSTAVYIQSIYKFENGKWSQLLSCDGRLIKVWKSLDEYEKFNITQQPYYATSNWYNYDASVDNTTTISADEYNYYTDESTNLYQEIQNNIDNSISVSDNSVTVTETYIQNIVNNTYTEINNNIQNYYPDSGENNDSGDDSGDSNGSTSDNDTGTGGTGVGDFLSGLTAILDTILSLVGKVMSIVADFTESILNLFSGLTTFTDGFSDFLAGAFGFIPAEIWDIIKVGLSLAILAGIIKFFRK